MRVTLIVFLIDDPRLIEDALGGFFTFSNMAAQRLGLIERQPPVAAVAVLQGRTPQNGDIDALVIMFNRHPDTTSSRFAVNLP